MKKRLITIAGTIAVVLGSATASVASEKEIPSQVQTQAQTASQDTVIDKSTQYNLPFVTFTEGATVTLSMPAYATGNGKVYRNKTVIQDLSYKKIDSGECYTYVFTRELKMKKSEVLSLGSDAAISCKFGAFDKYSGNTIGFGLNPETDIISADESGVGADVYLADVSVGENVYTLSSYKLKSTPFIPGDDGYFHSTSVEVVNIPKGYDGFSLVTYGLTDEEHEKASEFDDYDTANGYTANIYTQLSTFIDSSHIAYYSF